jgi:hypothetical protein
MNQPMNDPEDAGRGTDNVLGHLTTGELVVPIDIVNDPQNRKALEQMFAASNTNFNEFLVGDPANKINPETGYPEFFKKLVRAVVRPVQRLVGGVASALGLAPKAPQMPAMPEMPKAPPTVATAQVQAAADAQRMRARAASGRAATMLTGREDDEMLKPKVGTKKLMGY